MYVIAGTNGAGKSTVVGAAIRETGADYFNPDEAARRIRSVNPHITEREANAAAWQEGRRLLEHAIDKRLTFAFETTLGGNTITTLLLRALATGIAVRVWYVGLATPDLHIARVRSRVAAGGHGIPEGKIRERYERSRVNLIRLLPQLTELRVFDNSADADPAAGRAPIPLLVLHLANGTIVECDLSKVPSWAKPMVAAAMRSSNSQAR
ncbi:MAG: zeta toxin family protein [Acidobacteria bacterium]|nr:zeta toxin family protein [Acidobacteriota bacterium]